MLTPADESHHVDKHDFKVPFVCGAKDLGEALRRISEGAAMIRTKGDAGTGMSHILCSMCLQLLGLFLSSFLVACCLLLALVLILIVLTEA